MLENSTSFAGTNFLVEEPCDCLCVCETTKLMHYRFSVTSAFKGADVNEKPNRSRKCRPSRWWENYPDAFCRRPLLIATARLSEFSVALCSYRGFQDRILMCTQREFPPPREKKLKKGKPFVGLKLRIKVKWIFARIAKSARFKQFIILFCLKYANKF